MNKSQLDKYEKAILKSLYDNGGAWMTLNEIAKKTGMSWVTIKKHIEDLRKDKLIVMEDIDGEEKGQSKR